MMRQRLNHLEIELVAFVPTVNRAGCQRQFGMGDYFFGVEEIGVAQAVASRAGTHRVVERKEARFQFGQAV